MLYESIYRTNIATILSPLLKFLSDIVNICVFSCLETLTSPSVVTTVQIMECGSQQPVGLWCHYTPQIITHISLTVSSSVITLYTTQIITHISITEQTCSEIGIFNCKKHHNILVLKNKQFVLIFNVNSNEICNYHNDSFSVYDKYYYEGVYVNCYSICLLNTEHVIISVVSCERISVVRLDMVSTSGCWHH